MYVAKLYNMRKITCEFRFIFTYKSVFYLLFHFLKSVSLPCLSDILKLSGNCEKERKTPVNYWEFLLVLQVSSTYSSNHKAQFAPL